MWEEAMIGFDLTTSSIAPRISRRVGEQSILAPDGTIRWSDYCGAGDQDDSTAGGFGVGVEFTEADPEVLKSNTTNVTRSLGLKWLVGFTYGSSYRVMLGMSAAHQGNWAEGSGTNLGAS
ncbi:hypothetical protein N7463_010535 [Penicillium fimorum]|uniref:Uncharacterized protein n=1 Tax=Penicillium fimorum TaxID=1882269 RepID=A0A9W9XK39_9EURO|nr:hypothetical protein N7463_010535 [Penicillium fimorum]